MASSSATVHSGNSPVMEEGFTPKPPKYDSFKLLSELDFSKLCSELREINEKLSSAYHSSERQKLLRQKNSKELIWYRHWMRLMGDECDKRQVTITALRVHLRSQTTTIMDLQKIPDEGRKRKVEEDMIKLQKESEEAQIEAKKSKLKIAELERELDKARTEAK